MKDKVKEFLQDNKTLVVFYLERMAKSGKTEYPCVKVLFLQWNDGWKITYFHTKDSLPYWDEKEGFFRMKCVGCDRATELLANLVSYAGLAEKEDKYEVAHKLFKKNKVLILF